METLENPDGRLRNRDIDTGAPGKSFSSHGSGSFDVGQEIEPTEVEAMRFASEVAHRLEEKRQSESIERIILAADAKFLGHLRKSLTKECDKRVSHSVTSDLGGISDRDLPQHFKEALPV